MSREEKYAGREPTHDEVIAEFRRYFRDRKWPAEATDSEIQELLFKHGIDGHGWCGPDKISGYMIMTGSTWKLWLSWQNVCPQNDEKPRLSDKRAFVAAAREAFTVAKPGGQPLSPQEILPPPTPYRQEVDAPWTDTETRVAMSFREKFSHGAQILVECGDDLSRMKGEMVHGRFLRWIEECLPVGRRTVQQLIQIAGDPNIRAALGPNAQRVAHLPPERLALTEICGLPEAEFGALIDQGIIHPEMKRGDIRRHRVRECHNTAVAQPGPLPEAKHGAILADPPWPWEAWSKAGKSRSPENYYPTMTILEIEQLPVGKVAADDAVLFLWVTPGWIPDAPRIMAHWGFEYRTTAFVWVKEGQPGLGYWTRKQTELCLLGVRGKPKRLATDVPDVILAPRTEHSAKPDEVYWRMERLVEGPYLELFARRSRLGWNRWGKHWR